MTSEQNRQAHTVISYYQKIYSDKFGKRPVVNRNKLQYLIANVLKDLSLKEIKALLDFYVKTTISPSLLYFCYEYDEIMQKRDQESEDLEMRKQLMIKTQQNVEEFRRRYGDVT